MAPPTSDSAPAIAALEMRNVTVVALQDPARVVLKQVNWTVAVGEFWAVGGLLRSGKSDLLSVTAGIMRPAEGSYRLFGREIISSFERDDLALRLRIGLVFDGGHLLHHLTLAENIALPLRYHFHPSDGEMEASLQSLLALTGLEQWADSYPAEVNRNWQQRIGLARALALKPEVLLFDAPLTGLDPQDALWWLETIDALSAGHAVVDRRPLTIIVTSDDLRPWQNRATQFAVLRNQQLLVLGRRADLEKNSEPLLQDWLPPSGTPPNVTDK